MFAFLATAEPPGGKSLPDRYRRRATSRRPRHYTRAGQRTTSDFRFLKGRRSGTESPSLTVVTRLHGCPTAAAAGNRGAGYWVLLRRGTDEVGRSIAHYFFVCESRRWRRRSAASAGGAS